MGGRKWLASPAKQTIMSVIHFVFKNYRISSHHPFILSLELNHQLRIQGTPLATLSISFWATQAVWSPAKGWSQRHISIPQWAIPSFAPEVWAHMSTTSQKTKMTTCFFPWFQAWVHGWTIPMNVCDIKWNESQCFASLVKRVGLLSKLVSTTCSTWDWGAN